MPKRIGSQYRYSLREAGVKLLMAHKDQILIWDTHGKRVEIWGRSDYFAGSVLVYKGKSYEFVRTLR
mgnify:CR=1 FL=1